MNKESVGKKAWFKTWWGVFVMIVLLPITLICLVWKKTEWKSYIKGLATAGILVAFSAVASTGDQPKAVEEVAIPRVRIETPVVQEKPAEEAVEPVVEEITPEVVTEPEYEEAEVETPAVTAFSCDPNYSGACVPVDTDVDCAGGSGNGPSYVVGPVTVMGTDIYDLDRNGDGIGCES